MNHPDLTDVPEALRRALARQMAQPDPVKWPPVDRPLLERLDAAFPLKKPDIDDDLARCQRRAGQRDVIDALRTIFDTQNPE